jgi:hypothetical protein
MIANTNREAKTVTERILFLGVFKEFLCGKWKIIEEDIIEFLFGVFGNARNFIVWGSYMY